MKRDEIYKKAIDTFGSVGQAHMLLEEIAELQKEICKDLRNGTTEQSKARVIDEIADVEIMLEQMKIVYNIDPNVFMSRKRFKKKRLAKMLETIKQD